MPYSGYSTHVYELVDNSEFTFFAIIGTINIRADYLVIRLMKVKQSWIYADFSLTFEIIILLYIYKYLYLENIYSKSI